MTEQVRRSARLVEIENLLRQNPRGLKTSELAERTGYSSVHARGAGPDVQVVEWQKAYAASMRQQQPYDIHFVRDFHGLEVHWEQFSGQRDGAFVMSQSWWAPMPYESSTRSRGC